MNCEFLSLLATVMKVNAYRVSVFGGYRNRLHYKNIIFVKYFLNYVSNWVVTVDNYLIFYYHRDVCGTAVPSLYLLTNVYFKLKKGTALFNLC